MNWVNQLGMLFEFLSFLFFVPELFGLEKIRKWDQSIQKFLHKDSTPKNISKAFLRIMLILGIVWLIYTSFWGLKILISYEFLDPDTPAAIRLFLINLIVYIFVGFLVKVISLIVTPIGKNLINKVIAPSLRLLEENDSLSRNLLLFGAFLYVFGFILQFASSFN